MSYEEFESWYKKSEMSVEAEMNKIFNKIDADNDGSVTHEELETLCKEFHGGLAFRPRCRLRHATRVGGASLSRVSRRGRRSRHGCLMPLVCCARLVGLLPPPRMGAAGQFASHDCGASSPKPARTHLRPQPPLRRPACSTASCCWHVGHVLIESGRAARVM